MEVHSLRNRVRELETENDRLKSKLNGSSAEFMQLQAELERLRANEHQVKLQVDLLEKQRRSLEASSDIRAAYKTLRQQVLQIAESIRMSNPSWFVSFIHLAEQQE